MRSSNPVLTRLSPRGYAAPGGYAPAPSPGGSYPSPVVPTVTDRMTVDDVVIRTVGLLALTVASAAVAWAIVPFQYLSMVWIGAMLIGLVLGFVIALSQITNPVLLATYAVVEGVFLGMVSKAYEFAYAGIVLQAVLATAGVFFAMALLYKSKAIRATPRFNKIVIGCLAGAAVIIMVNLFIALLGFNAPIWNNGPIGLIFSIAMIVLGALSFVTDFDLIERSVAAGAPKNVAWTCAFGLLVGLIFVYIYVLRLIAMPATDHAYTPVGGRPSCGRRPSGAPGRPVGAAPLARGHRARRCTPERCAARADPAAGRRWGRRRGPDPPDGTPAGQRPRAAGSAPGGRRRPGQR